MREPEKAEGRPHGPQPKKTATNCTNDLVNTVPAHRRGGDPRRRHRLYQQFGRRRISRELDLALGIIRPIYDVPVDVDWYHVTGLDLGYEERERAAQAGMPR